MSLQSKIIAIRNIKQGEKIGYGYKYCAKKNQRIGIVACGYGDGYPRSIPITGTPVLVDNIKTNIIGQISMDMLTVDLNNCHQAKIGSKVELWGNIIKIDEIAKLAGTVSYQIMSSITSRVPIKII